MTPEPPSDEQRNKIGRALNIGGIVAMALIAPFVFLLLAFSVSSWFYIGVIVAGAYDVALVAWLVARRRRSSR